MKHDFCRMLYNSKKFEAVIEIVQNIFIILMSVLKAHQSSFTVKKEFKIYTNKKMAIFWIKTKI